MAYLSYYRYHTPRMAMGYKMQNTHNNNYSFGQKFHESVNEVKALYDAAKKVYSIVKDVAPDVKTVLGNVPSLL